MKHLLIAILFITLSLSARTTVYSCNFAQGRQGWGGWTENPNNKITITTPVVDGHAVLDLKGSDGGWLTPIINLDKKILCTDRTMLSFRVWTDEAITCDINLGNAEEQAQYSFTFVLPANQWLTLNRYLAKSYYRFQGSPDIPNDGFQGDHLWSIQIATRGRHVMLDTVEIYEADSTTEKETPPDAPHIVPMQLKTKQVKEIVAKHLQQLPVTPYPELQRNGFFPFAVVLREDANETKSTQFGEDLEASLQRDLVDLKRHYINTYYDFCVSGTADFNRLRRAEQVGLRLVETCYCHTDFTKANQQTIDDFERVRQSPAILGWYGLDEPQLEHVEGYLANKRWVNTHDPKHPYTSAMHLEHIRRLLGPAMEVMIPDIYSLRPNSPLNDPKPMLDHAPICKGFVNHDGGKPVWFMTQTFSNRHPNAQRNPVFSSRYPTPLEIRLDMYATLAGGARGISFFIYNDHVSFLGGIRGEKFDFTLVDPWGNDNPTYREIAAFGRRIVPIMPSIMDATFSQSVAAKTDTKDFLLEQTQNRLGNYLFVVNRSLTEQRTAHLDITLPAGKRLYSLTSLAETTPDISLEPGYGEILAIVTPEAFTQLKNEIEARRRQQQDELANLRAQQLRKAGFTPDTVTAEWLQQEQRLDAIQQDFGVLYQELANPKNIVVIDSNPDYQDLHDTLCKLSKIYFDARAQHATAHLKTVPDIRPAIKKLQEDYLTRLHK